MVWRLHDVRSIACDGNNVCRDNLSIHSWKSSFFTRTGGRVYLRTIMDFLRATMFLAKAAMTDRGRVALLTATIAWRYATWKISEQVIFTELTLAVRSFSRHHHWFSGASSFMSTMSISYFFFIFVYDIQKIIQSLFSKEYTGGANYRSLNRRSTVRINNSVAPNANLAERKPGPRSSHGSGFKPQDWKYVDTDAWVILLTTSLECFIEGLCNL